MLWREREMKAGKGCKLLHNGRYLNAAKGVGERGAG